MKVAAKAARALSEAASSSRRSFLTRSTLLRTRTGGVSRLAIFLRMRSTSSSTPLVASTISATRSASPAPPQAASTMARSSRRRGAKMPGVSMKTSWLVPSVAMPRTGMRVVCTLRLTMDTLAPTSALTSVDLPALGAPMTAMKPQRVSGAGVGMGAGSLIGPAPRPRARAAPWRRPARRRACWHPRRARASCP